jgi:hypothetical protein
MNPRRWPDLAILAEWERRREKYIAKTKNLRFSFYIILIISIASIFFGEESWRYFGVALFFSNFVAHVVALNIIRIRTLRCPNCEKTPSAGRSETYFADVCGHCFSYLRPFPVEPRKDN